MSTFWKIAIISFCALVALGDDTSTEVENELRGRKHCSSSSGARLKCSAFGDPHYISFDCRRINYQGVCEHVLAEKCCNCNSDDDMPDFHVYLTNENRRSNNRVSWARSLKIVYGCLVIYLDKSKMAAVNGELVTPPYKPSEDTELLLTSDAVVFKTSAGLEVAFLRSDEVTVHAPKAYAGKLCGLCGNGDGNPSNDMKMKNGNLAKSQVDFGNSWIAHGSNCSGKPEDVAPKKDAKLDAKLAAKDKCGLIKDKRGPLKKCIDVVSEIDDIYGTCMFDAKLMNDLSTDKADSPICENIAAVVEECQEQGVKGIRWRKNKFCPMKCGRNSRYVAYTSDCPASCADPQAPKKCKGPMKEGCACNKGFILSGEECVRKQQCGCLYGGQYKKAGTTWLSHHCNRQLTCKNGKAGIISKKVSCKTGHCIINNKGLRKCVCPNSQGKDCLRVPKREEDSDVIGGDVMESREEDSFEGDLYDGEDEGVGDVELPEVEDEDFENGQLPVEREEEGGEEGEEEEVEEDDEEAADDEGDGDAEGEEGTGDGGETYDELEARETSVLERLMERLKDIETNH